jgi:serine O-acetyltransferase
MAVKTEASCEDGSKDSGRKDYGTNPVGQPIRHRTPWGTTWPEDIQVVFDKDPAAHNVLEVLLYQGLHAVLLHRLAHWLHIRGIPFLPRLISQLGRILTGGIEINPGAKIGRRFFIDHGSGIVIGETAEIGDDVMLYHQVTLGATGWWKDIHNSGSRRHPRIENAVTIGTGATILGPVTVGRGTKIGALALVIEDLPPNSVVVGHPARYITRDGIRVHDLPLESFDDPGDYQI